MCSTIVVRRLFSKTFTRMHKRSIDSEDDNTMCDDENAKKLAEVSCFTICRNETSINMQSLTFLKFSSGCDYHTP